MPIFEELTQAAYLEKFSYGKSISNAALWAEMDRVWDRLGLDRHGMLAAQQEQVASFYSHPVWILNGLFSEEDAASAGHRRAIATCVGKLDSGVEAIADFGGGSGVLGKLLVEHYPHATLHIVEPFPSDYFVERNAAIPGLRYTADFLHANYDVVIAQDVLEHVDDPVEVAVRCVAAAKRGGHLIFANSFWPLIKCHLPATFYLRHTFPILMRAAGLQYVGRVPGAEHAQIFKKLYSAPPWRAARAAALLKPIGKLANRLATPRAGIARRLST